MNAPTSNLLLTTPDGARNSQRLRSATQAERSLAEPFDLSLQNVSVAELLATGDRGLALELSFGLTSRYRDRPVELEAEIDDVLRVAQSIPAGFQATGGWGPWSAQAVGTLSSVAGRIGTSVNLDPYRWPADEATQAWH